MTSRRLALRSFASNAQSVTTAKSAKSAKSAKTSKTSKTSASSIPSTLFNEARLPFVKYVVGESSWRRVQDNRATTEERKKVVEAIKTFLPRRPAQLLAIEAAREALEKQSVVPTVQHKKAETPAEMLERIKPNVLEALGVEASQYDQVAEDVLKAYNEEQNALHEKAEDGNRTPNTDPTLAANPSMNDAQRATVQSIINEMTR